MKNIRISTGSLKGINKHLKKDGLKMCSETYMVLPLKDKYFGKRFVDGEYIYQPYCKFAR